MFGHKFLQIRVKESGKQYRHDAKKLFLVDCQIFERLADSSGGLGNFYILAIHRRQRRRPTAPSPRHRTLQPRQIQRRPRQSEKTLGGLIAFKATVKKQKVWTVNFVKKELEETRELANYISDDFQATQRLREIREKAEIALDVINQIGGFSFESRLQAAKPQKS